MGLEPHRDQLARHALAVGLDAPIDESGFEARTARLLEAPANLEDFLDGMRQAGRFFVNGQAVLSPIRFFYDSEKFELPVTSYIVLMAEKIAGR